MLKVWGRRSSFNVQKVLWLIGEHGLAHEHIPAGGSFGRLDEPVFRAMNPRGRVPVLEDGAAVIWESHTILRYLAARYSREKFWLDDPAARARVEGWMD
jgi:glutathione S-transferase